MEAIKRFLHSLRYMLYNQITLVPYLECRTLLSWLYGAGERSALRFCGVWCMNGVSSWLSSASPSESFAVNFPLYSSRRSTIEYHVKRAFRSMSARTELLGIEVLTVLYLASMYSMRIAEVLSLTSKHYIGSNRFVCQAVKRSQSYIVVVDMLPSSDSFDCLQNDAVTLWSLSYNPVWRACRRVGLGATIAGHKTVSRTHAHRYLTAASVAAISNERTAGDVLHHRSSSSVSFYLPKKEACHGKIE